MDFSHNISSPTSRKKGTPPHSDLIPSWNQRLAKNGRQLGSLLDANRRSSVYRHHVFYRRTRHVISLIKKVASKKSANSTKVASRKASPAELRTAILAAGHAVASEIASERIDTIAVCVGIFGLLATAMEQLPESEISNTDKSMTIKNSACGHSA